MTYINNKYYSRKELKILYDAAEKPFKLTFNNFYLRVHTLGWSIEKALSYEVRDLKNNVIQKELIND